MSYSEELLRGREGAARRHFAEEAGARLTLAQILADDWCQSKVVDDFSHVANAFELFNATNPYLSSAPSSAPSQ